MEIQRTAEARDIPALLKNLANGREALTTELDAHIALEEDDAFALIEQVVGKEFVAPFRAERQGNAHSAGQACWRVRPAGAYRRRWEHTADLCLELCDLIHEHMQREDAMLFPSARDALAL